MWVTTLCKSVNPLFHNNRTVVKHGLVLLPTVFHIAYKIESPNPQPLLLLLLFFMNK